MDLPGIPPNAWVVVKHSLNTGADLLKAQVAVFPAARELWCFVVSTTLHVIWVERLRRMEDPSLSQDVHTARAKTIIAGRFEAFVDQPTSPTWGKTSKERSPLADTLLCYDEPPSLLVRPIERCPGVLCVTFING